MAEIDVIVIGGGAAGLMTSRELVRKGKTVCLLEARDRVGGRINTVYDSPVSEHIEMGAEFVHGNLEATMQLLKEGNIGYHRMGGTSWHYRGGALKREQHFVEGWDLLEEKLTELQEDMSIDDFLERWFSGDEYNGLRNSVRGFAVGYDTADPARASAIALREEWMSEDGQVTYRLNNGYGEMIEYLLHECEEGDFELLLNNAVTEIHCQEGRVTIFTENEESYLAKQVIVTVPMGVLQAGKIKFVPEIPEYNGAMQDMGYGSIIKLLFVFREAFWETLANKYGNMKELSFLLSDQEIPTWWTQYPRRSTVLTGWLGGPKAALLKHASDESVEELGLQSLANIFGMSMEVLRALLVTSEVANWNAEPFTLGSYGYATTETEKARKVLAMPVQGTIYFAGEAMYGGKEMGTVEAALKSGIEVAQKIK